MRLFLSTTGNLPAVRYQGEIVGWDDKRSIAADKRAVIESIIRVLQPGERELYDASAAPGGVSLNLLHVRRLQRLQQPFSVERLVKVRDGGRLSPNRSMSGGWSYVRPNPAP